MRAKRENQTEMYLELAVYGYRGDPLPFISKLKVQPDEIAKKGEVIVNETSKNRSLSPLVDKYGAPRKWKENFLTYKFDSKKFILEDDLSEVLKFATGLKKKHFFKAAQFGIKCVIYLKNDRPDASISKKTIRRLANINCYLEFSVY